MKIERGMTVVYRKDIHPAQEGKVVATHPDIKDNNIYVEWDQDSPQADTVEESDWYSPDQLLIVPTA